MLLVWDRTVLSDTDELAGDRRAVQVRREETQHLELAFAQRLDQRPVGRVRFATAVEGCQEVANIGRGDATFQCGRQQGRHRVALIDEHPDVALRLGK